MAKKRKWQQLLAALGGELDAPESAMWSDLKLRPLALPEVDLDEVRMDTVFLGHGLRYPVLVGALTGGHRRLATINRRLATLTHRNGLAMSVGSQREQLVEPEAGTSFRVVRRAAPTSFIMANIGAAQLVEQVSGPRMDARDLEQLVESIQADALVVHANFVHEALQPEGDTRAYGVLEALGHLVKELHCPVLVKETGSGLDRLTARRLEAVGVAALETAGAGGASMARMERRLAQWRGDDQAASTAATFVDWGIPAPASFLEVRQATSVPVIAGGGIRTGLDAVRALAAGADLVSVSLPLIQKAASSDNQLQRWMNGFLQEMRLGMFLVGAASLGQLRDMAPVVLTGSTREYVEMVNKRPMV